MNYDESVNYLLDLGHETLAMKFGLENTEKMLAALGNPQRDFPKVQIVGTNGKGSTAAFLSTICAAANIVTGLYTSPHLSEITERIKINNVEISQTDFAAVITIIRKTAEKLIERGELAAAPTFFEHLTLAALVYFRENNVKLAILETGLGGRLDATTAANAEIVGITPISLDHQNYLGDTLEEIAAEKAAVIRPNVRAVAVAPQKPAAHRIIADKCRQHLITEINSAEIVKTNKINDSAKLSVGFKTTASDYSNIKLSLLGRHQLENAALAITLAEILRRDGFEIPSEAIISGLETAFHSGRLEFVDGILLDGAHNADGAQVLKDFLTEFFPNSEITLIFAAMTDKDLREIAEILFSSATNLILTRANNPRSAAPEDLRELTNNQAIIAQNIKDALISARQTNKPNNLICISGSLYLVGEARRMLRAGK